MGCFVSSDEELTALDKILMPILEFLRDNARNVILFVLLAVVIAIVVWPEKYGYIFEAFLVWLGFMALMYVLNKLGVLGDKE